MGNSSPPGVERSSSFLTYSLPTLWHLAHWGHCMQVGWLMHLDLGSHTLATSRIWVGERPPGQCTLPPHGTDVGRLAQPTLWRLSKETFHPAGAETMKESQKIGGPILSSPSSPGSVTSSVNKHWSSGLFLWASSTLAACCPAGDSPSAQKPSREEGMTLKAQWLGRPLPGRTSRACKDGGDGAVGKQRSLDGACGSR